MAENNNTNLFILLSILGIILLIPLIKAKEPELGGDIIKEPNWERIK